MWVKKTQQDIDESQFELKREKLDGKLNKKRLKSALISSAITFVIVTALLILRFLTNTGHDPYKIEKPNTWQEIYNLSSYYWLVPIVFSTIVFYLNTLLVKKYL
jgi:hypothetical protein